jgi:uncharacterized protein YciI
MLFVVQFEDHPERLDVRQRDLPLHLAFLKHHAQHILGAGSLREQPEGPAVGSIWIVELPTKAEVETLCHQDPFWTGGLRRSMRILHWAKAFPEPRLI